MNRINLILKEIPSEAALKKAAVGFCFSFLINKTADLKNISLTKLHSTTLYSFTKVNFSICFNCKEEDDIAAVTNYIEEHIDFVMQLFFHPQFERNDTLPLIFANKNLSANSKFLSMFDRVNSFAKKQGFNKLELRYISETEIVDDITDKEFNVDDVAYFTDEYHLLLTKQYYVGRYVNFICKSEELIYKIFELKNNVENQIGKGDSILHKYLIKHAEYRKRIPQLEHELILLKEDLDNQKAYLKILKEQDEASKINKFYHNEYEILPLWYKKFGHILKVISGKRSFRSLFYNNVKKYNS